MGALEFALYIMARFNFQAEAVKLLQMRCEYVLLDPVSTRGGGGVLFGYGNDLTIVTFNTVQEEAAVHELAHAWWYEIERPLTNYDKNAMVDRLLEACLAEADLPQEGPYKRVREVCHDYKYGWPGRPQGFWMEDLQRYDHDEFFAGIASATMGDLTAIPESMRDIYIGLFSGEPAKNFTYLPDLNSHHVVGD